MSSLEPPLTAPPNLHAEIHGLRSAFQSTQQWFASKVTFSVHRNVCVVCDMPPLLNQSLMKGAMLFCNHSVYPITGGLVPDAAVDELFTRNDNFAVPLEHLMSEAVMSRP